MQNQSQNLEQLTADMRELRIIYNWTDADVAEIKQAARETPAWWAWFSVLAQAFRNGYSPTLANNFERMHIWQERIKTQGEK